MNTDKHRFYIRKRFKETRTNGTRMNTDNQLKGFMKNFKKVKSFYLTGAQMNVGAEYRRARRQ
jgi:hypothetical protein